MTRAEPTFTAIPNDSSGEPLLATYDEQSFARYIDWLADYLYRPSTLTTSLALTFEEAWARVSVIETAIAHWIWDHPFEDYPPGLDERTPRHADFPHRAELSHALSRVSCKEHRVDLLRRFYRELARDAAK
jgi:hypothetical protein